MMARVGALRSLFVGVSDRDLLDWVTDGSPAVEAALVQLDHMVDVLQALPPHAALSRIAWEHEWWTFLATRSTADVDIGMLQRILALFRDTGMSGRSWLHALELLQAARDEDRKIPLHTTRISGSSSVRIMTVHGAKGLQARTVFLANPGTVTARPPVRHFDSSSGAARVVLPVLEQKGFHTSVRFAPRNWPDIQATEKAYEDAESIRLLYVACTRAAERLFVTVRQKGGTGYWDVLTGALQRHGHGPSVIAAHTPVVEDERPAPAESVWSSAGAALDARRTRVQALASEQYRVVRPSELGVHETPISEGHGPGGKVFGQAVHTMFEWLINRRHDMPDPGALRSHVRSFHALPAWESAYDDGMLAAAHGLMEGPLWTLVQRAQDVLVEVPFTTGLTSDEDVVQVVSGTVDLALRQGSMWMLVDFKTDRLDAQDLVALHGPQVRTYVTCWRNMFHDDEVEATLWSTWLNRLIPVQEEAS
jgi:ATP-dependent helicase/nuclease subunit A